jgi:hypothetical protein
MTAPKPARKRPYLHHGLTALTRALKRVEEGHDWTQGLGQVGVALRAWRGDLIDALGGEDAVSPQQRALVELATRTHLMVESVDRFILGMPCLVNKSKRSIFGVVTQRQQLADVEPIGGGLNGNGAMRATATTTTPPGLWWPIVSRGDLELRRRGTLAQWRLVCPVDASHAVTLANGTPGLALTCHGPAGTDSPGHSLSVHRTRRQNSGEYFEHFPDLSDIPFPCRWCGCAESQVLAALGARPRDKFPQPGGEPCSIRACAATGYAVESFPAFCLVHLVDRVGLARDVLFGDAQAARR